MRRLRSTIPNKQYSLIADILHEMIDEVVLTEEIIIEVSYGCITGKRLVTPEYCLGDWETLDQLMWVLCEDYNSHLPQSQWIFFYDGEDTNDRNFSEDQMKLRRLFRHVQDIKRGTLLHHLGFESQFNVLDINRAYIEDVLGLLAEEPEFSRRASNCLKEVSETFELHINKDLMQALLLILKISVRCLGLYETMYCFIELILYTARNPTFYLIPILEEVTRMIYDSNFYNLLINLGLDAVIIKKVNALLLVLDCGQAVGKYSSIIYNELLKASITNEFIPGIKLIVKHSDGGLNLSQVNFDNVRLIDYTRAQINRILKSKNKVKSLKSLSIKSIRRIPRFRQLIKKLPKTLIKEIVTYYEILD